MKANRYLRCTGETAYLKLGHAESNTYVGSSNVLSNVVQAYVLTDDDIVCDLVGGIFVYVASVDTLYGAVFEANPKHPFEKVYLPKPAYVPNGVDLGLLDFRSLSVHRLEPERFEPKALAVTARRFGALDWLVP